MRWSTRNYASIFSCTCTSASIRSNHERRGSTFCCSFLRERERVHLSPHIPSDPAFARWAPVRLAHGASIARNFKNSRPMQSITEPRARSLRFLFAGRGQTARAPRRRPGRFPNRRSSPALQSSIPSLRMHLCVLLAARSQRSVRLSQRYPRI